MNTVKANKGSTKKRTRKGRGIPSGAGKTSGRGHRGQKCRSGWSAMPHKEGGQTPLYRRLPKRQVNTRLNRKVYTIINLDQLQELADQGAKEIDVLTFIEHGLIKSIEDSGIKVLANGEIKSPVKVIVDKYSESAKAAIEKAGGTISLSSEAEK